MGLAKFNQNLKSVTIHAHEDVNKYFNEIRKYKSYTIAEEKLLFQAHENGDLSVREKIIKANLKFVVSVAKKYQGSGLPLKDLISSGNDGLIVAFEKFDYNRNVKFFTYAVSWIHAKIKESIASDKRMIRLPQNQIKKISDEKKKGDEDKDHGILGSIEMKMVSIHDHINEDGDMFLELLEDKSFPSPDNVFDKNGDDDLSQQIKQIIQVVLDEREQTVIDMYYGLTTQDPIKFNSIAEELDLSVERVRQIKIGAIRKIRACCGNLLGD